MTHPAGANVAAGLRNAAVLLCAHQSHGTRACHIAAAKHVVLVRQGTFARLHAYAGARTTSWRTAACLAALPK